MTYGQRAERRVRAGGWGELFGDEGFLAAGLAKSAAPAGVLANERRPDSGEIALDVLHRTPRRPLQSRRRRRGLNRWQGNRRDISARCRQVVEAARRGDMVAARVLTDAAAELVLLVETTCRRLGFAAAEPVPVFYSGGVLSHAPGVLVEGSSSISTASTTSERRGSPVIGAALYAAKLAGAPLATNALEHSGKWCLKPLRKGRARDVSRSGLLARLMCRMAASEVTARVRQTVRQRRPVRSSGLAGDYIHPGSTQHHVVELRAFASPAARRRCGRPRRPRHQVRRSSNPCPARLSGPAERARPARSGRSSPGRSSTVPTVSTALNSEAVRHQSVVSSPGPSYGGGLGSGAEAILGSSRAAYSITWPGTPEPGGQFFGVAPLLPGGRAPLVHDGVARRVVPLRDVAEHRHQAGRGSVMTARSCIAEGPALRQYDVAGPRSVHRPRPRRSG